MLGQRRSGDTLLVRAERRGVSSGIFFKPTYAYLEINAQLPAGIDVELGRALAEALGVKFSALPFAAGENMDDDLRHMVWRGHYLGFGPADVLLHVPVDRPLM